MGEPMLIMLANLSDNVPLSPWVTTDYYFLPLSLPNTTSDSLYEFSTIGIGAELDCAELKESSSNLSYRFTLSNDAMEANFSTAETASDGSVIRCFYPVAFIGDNANPPAEATQVYIRGNPEGKQGVEMFFQPIPSQVTATALEKYTCPRRAVAGWVRSQITLTDMFSDTLYGPTRNITNSSIESTFMMCQPQFKASNFTVVSDQAGHILNYTKINSPSIMPDENLTGAIWNATMFLVGQGLDYLEWHNDTIAVDWFNLLLKNLAGPDIIDPISSQPDFASTKNRVNQTYQRLFASVLEYNKEYFVPAPAPITTLGYELSSKQRVFFSDTMFLIVILMLALDVVAAMAVYIQLPSPFLHQMPTSIAGLLSYAICSHLENDFTSEKASTLGKAAAITENGNVYGLGKYIGTDGRGHFGIDRQPYLLPLQIDDAGRWTRLRNRIFHFRKSKLQSEMI
jgi:hypothetical protein